MLNLIFKIIFLIDIKIYYMIFKNTLLKIKNKGLNVKQNISFPLNTSVYKKIY